LPNRFFSPDQQFADQNGIPYSGGLLYFYASGTSTPLNTYSDSTLTIPNTNPVVLNSAGRAGSVFLQNLAYKVVLTDANNNQIWTEDPVYSSDYSTIAQVQSTNGSPTGQLAGSQGSTTIPASMAWDYVSDILYICTTTGSATTAVWTAVNATAAAAIVPPPQGYLTLTSGTAVINSDVIGATAVYYMPYIGNLCPIFNGASFQPTAFVTSTLMLSTSQALNTLYDVFLFNNASVPTLAVGPAWSSSTAGSCTRGTGAGTTQISQLNGIWVNTVQISGRNGSNTYTIPPNEATYLGSIYIDATAGQVSCYRSAGQSRKWGVWNAYNRVPLCLQIVDSTASWLYTTATFRPSNNNTANSATVFSGLAEELYTLTFNQLLVYSNDGGIIGLGYNSTTAASGLIGTSVSSASLNQSVAAGYIAPPSLGINTVTLLEKAGATGGANFFGTTANMAANMQWRG
jgi:hypothetical protein